MLRAIASTILLLAVAGCGFLIPSGADAPFYKAEGKWQGDAAPVVLQGSADQRRVTGVMLTIQDGPPLIEYRGSAKGNEWQTQRKRAVLVDDDLQPIPWDGKYAGKPLLVQGLWDTHLRSAYMGQDMQVVEDGKPHPYYIISIARID